MAEQAAPKKKSGCLGIFAVIIAVIFFLAMCDSDSGSSSSNTPPADDLNPEPPTAYSIPTEQPEAPVIDLPAEPSAPPAAPTEAPAAQDPSMTPEEFLDTVYWHLYWFNECCIENYGAAVDYNQVYARVYSSQEAMMNGEAPIDIVPRSSLTTVTDPINANLYPIENYTSNAQIRSTLETYITSDLVSLLFNNPFQEFEGKLYFVEGSRGMGTVFYDVNSASVMELGEEYCTVFMDKYYFDQPDGEVMVKFQKLGGNWYIAEYQDW